jgi:Flp pilus assembly CpaE family ATPase
VLEQLGFSKSRFHVLVNRFDKKHGIGAAEIEKILSCPVHALVPNDYFSLHHAISLGQPLASDSNLHKAVDRVARGIIADGDAQRSAQAQEKRNGR